MADRMADGSPDHLPIPACGPFHSATSQDVRSLPLVLLLAGSHPASKPRLDEPANTRFSLRATEDCAHRTCTSAAARSVHCAPAYFAGCTQGSRKVPRSRQLSPSLRDTQSSTLETQTHRRGRQSALDVNGETETFVASDSSRPGEEEAARNKARRTPCRR